MPLRGFPIFEISSSAIASGALSRFVKTAAQFVPQTHFTAATAEKKSASRRNLSEGRPGLLARWERFHIFPEDIAILVEDRLKILVRRGKPFHRNCEIAHQTLRIIRALLLRIELSLRQPHLFAQINIHRRS